MDGGGLSEIVVLLQIYHITMAYITERRYALKSYHRAADKPDCPSCGHRHRFSEYIDLHTGLPVGPGCGKCDRENHCRYWMTPREYFRLHPDERQRPTSGIPARVLQHRPEKVFLPADVMTYRDPQGTMPYWYDVRFTLFGKWLATKAPNENQFLQAITRYRLSATATGAVLFWYLDEQGRCCQGKMMWYRADGHRNGFVNTVSSDLVKRGLMKENTEMHHCLFGAHLLAERPTDVVHIVESEKTAVTMSLLLPQFVWLATGGSTQLNPDVVSPLKGRRTVLFPDSGCLGKWRKVMEQTRGIPYSFFEDMERYPSNTDILDVYLGEA